MKIGNGDNFIHFHVVGFVGYSVYDLEGIAESDCVAMKKGKKAVVVAFASAQSVAFLVESHSGNNGKVDVRIFGCRDKSALRFHYVVGSYGCCRFIDIFVEFQVVAYY